MIFFCRRCNTNFERVPPYNRIRSDAVYWTKDGPELVSKTIFDAYKTNISHDPVLVYFEEHSDEYFFFGLCPICGDYGVVFEILSVINNIV